jgi:hypothetical protein
MLRRRAVRNCIGIDTSKCATRVCAHFQRLNVTILNTLLVSKILLTPMKKPASCSELR